MKIGTKEHYDMIENFEKNYRHARLDKEDKELWYGGRIYQDGRVNDYFYYFSLGYAMARSIYMDGDSDGQRQ